MNKFFTLLALVIIILCINFSSVYADDIENANLVTNNTDLSFSLNSSENEKTIFNF